MSKQRATAGKRQRELNKQTKAAAKRERRQRIADEPTASSDEAMVVPAAGDRSDASDAELLDLIEALHVQFDSHQIDFEMFEARKAELLARLQVD